MTDVFHISLSDTGLSRTVNEDYFDNLITDNFKLFVICDGMGGHNGGKLASKLAVTSIINYFNSLKIITNPEESLKKAVAVASQKLNEEMVASPEFEGMGTTVVIFLLFANYGYVAHLGDSRLYIIRNDSIEQLTKDHSLVREMVDAKLISESDAVNHPKKNVITKAIGANVNSEPEITGPISIYKKDKFLLCTDGLFNNVHGSEIFNIISDNSVNNAAKSLISLSNERGGQDNITVTLISIINGNKLPFNFYVKNKYNRRFFFSFLIISTLLYLNYIYVIPTIISRNFSNKSKQNKIGVVDSTKNNSNIKTDSFNNKPSGKK